MNLNDIVFIAVIMPTIALLAAFVVICRDDDESK
jgi:hypothetical protein